MSCVIAFCIFLFRAEEERKKYFLIRLLSQIKSIIEKLPRLTEADLERLGHRGAPRLAYYTPTLSGRRDPSN